MWGRVSEGTGSPVVGPTASGLYGDEPQTKGNWRFSIKQPCRTAISFGMALEWKIKTIKQKSIVSSLRAFKHLEGGRKMESDGNFFHHFHLTKGYSCVVYIADMLFLHSKYFRFWVQVISFLWLAFNLLYQWLNVNAFFLKQEMWLLKQLKFCNAMLGDLWKKHLCAFQTIFIHTLVRVVGFTHRILMSYTFSACCLISKYH